MALKCVLFMLPCAARATVSFWQLPTMFCVNRSLRRPGCLSWDIRTSRWYARSMTTLVVNAGAVGLPFDLDPRACYAQLTWQAGRWVAEIIRVEYDRAQADRDFDETGFVAEAGPIALLIRDELAQARSNLFEWTRDYEAAVIAGQLTMAESVTRFLAA